MSKIHEFESGEIRHSSKAPEAIMKVIGPLKMESMDKTGNVVKEMEGYILTNDFPAYHFVLINKIVDSDTEPSIKFAVVQLITHCKKYDNLKVTEDLYDKNTTEIDLTKSYITRNLFIINTKDITKKVRGNFDLTKLKEACEY
jgi:hypothetical protein